MELLLDNLREAIHGKGRREHRWASKADLTFIFYGVLIGALSFSLSRVSFFGVMYPCGTAMITVLMARGKWNIYALPLILLGIWSNTSGGYDLKADLAAAFLCGVLFFLLHRRALSMPVRGGLAAGITVIVKGIYYWLTHLLFLYDGVMLLSEGLLILIMVYLFHNILMPVGKETYRKKSAAENLGSLGALVTLVAAGILPSTVLGVTPIHVAALLATLLIGYRMGLMEGAVAGAFSGTVGMLLTASSPALVGILVCGGIMAGLFQGHSRLAASVCFAGVCLSFGAIKGYPGLYLPIWEPLIAAGVFALLPYSLLQKMDFLLARIRQDDLYLELEGKRRVTKMLKGYHEVFEKLAMTYSRPARGFSTAAGAAGNDEPLFDGDSGEGAWHRRAENSKSIMAYQFKGMARALETMMGEINHPTEKTAEEAPRFGIRMGISGYAKDDGISGDSYLCTDYRKDKYMIALSDGMGKGKRAAEESGLTIQSLYQLMKAGFDVDLALKIINSILLVKSTDEIFSTVDLGIVDLNSAKVKLFKIGAAATFIKRGNHVEMIKVSALPMGIIDRIPVDYVEIRLKKGDELIIVSDGITEADRGSQNLEWLRAAIEDIQSKDPQTMSDLILNQAMERYGLKEKDDMTVITARIQ